MPPSSLLTRARAPVSDLVQAATDRAGTPSPRRLHAALITLFVLYGAVLGSWAARLPDIAARVEATPSVLGAALLCDALGALASMRLTGALCRRLGAGPAAAIAAIAVCLALVLLGLATSLPALAAALLVFGAATGALNVAGSAAGLEAEERIGRRLLPGLHAGFSIGGLAGALLGGAASAVLGVGIHLIGVAVACLLLTAWALPTLAGAARQPTAPAPPAGRDDRRPLAALIVLGAIAGCTAYGEGALTDWGTLLLRQHLGAPPALAAAGYAGFALAMAAGRLAGARLAATLGERRLMVTGAVLAAVGATTAVTTSSIGTALGGFVLVGLGLANLFPLAIARAGRLGGAPGIALATTVGCTGLLGGPPLIGLLAQTAGLPVALGTIALAALLAGLLVTTVTGHHVQLPDPCRLIRRLQPVVASISHATVVIYVRDLRLLQVT